MEETSCGNVYIIVISHANQLDLLDKDILLKIDSGKKILIVADKMLTLPPELVSLFDVLDVVQCNHNPLGFDLLLHSPKDLQRAISRHVSGYAPENCYVLSSDEFNYESIIKASYDAGLTQYNPDTAKLFRNKDLMKLFLKKYKIRMPHHCLFNPALSYAEYVNLLGKKIIAKPLDMAGSIGVYIIDNLFDFQSVLPQLHKGSYELEAYIDGNLFHVDSIRIHNMTVSSIVCEYSYPLATFKQGCVSASIPIIPSHPHYADLQQINEQVLNAFNEDGIFHAEYFVDEQNQVVFLEIAARSPGHPEYCLYKNIYGVHQFTLYLALLAHVILIDELEKLHHHCDQFYASVPIMKGKFSGIEMPLDESEYETVKLAKIGDTFTSPPHCMAYVAQYKIKNHDYTQLMLAFQKIKAKCWLAVFN